MRDSERLYGIKGGQRTLDCASDEVFPMFFSKSIAGVSTLLIIVHHLSGSPIFENIPMAGIYRNIGMWCVTIFFFISGYGTASGFQKNSYRSKFWRHKFETIIIRFIIAFLIFLSVRILFGNYSFKKLLEGIGKGTTTVLYSWYIYALLLMYLFFAMSFSAKGRIRWGRFIFFGVMYLIIFCVLLHFPTHWYGSYPAFYAGVFLQSNKKFQGCLLKHRPILIPLLMMVFAVCYYVQMITLSFALRLLCGFCGVFALSILLFIFGGMVYVRRKLLLNVNHYGLEIYLYHGLVLEFLAKISTRNSFSPYAYIFIAEICALFLGVVMKKLGDLVLKLFRYFIAA